MNECRMRCRKRRRAADLPRSERLDVLRNHDFPRARILFPDDSWTLSAYIGDNDTVVRFLLLAESEDKGRFVHSRIGRPVFQPRRPTRRHEDRQMTATGVRSGRTSVLRVMRCDVPTPHTPPRVPVPPSLQSGPSRDCCSPPECQISPGQILLFGNPCWVRAAQATNDGGTCTVRDRDYTLQACWRRTCPRPFSCAGSQQRACCSHG